MPRKVKQTYVTEKEALPTVLKLLMSEKNFTQSDVAIGIGMTRQAVGLYGSGQSTPDANTLSKLADFFDVSCDYLLGRTDVPTPQMDIRGICKNTGLSANAVKSLINIKNNSNQQENRLQFLNDLLEDVGSLYFLSYSYWEYKNLISITYEVEKIESEHPIVLEQKLNEDFKLFRCQNQFINFLKKQTQTRNEGDV